MDGSVKFGCATPGIGIGQLQWTSGSMPPVITIYPDASTVRLAPIAANALAGYADIRRLGTGGKDGEVGRGDYPRSTLSLPAP